MYFRIDDEMIAWDLRTYWRAQAFKHKATSVGYRKIEKGCVLYVIAPEGRIDFLHMSELEGATLAEISDIAYKINLELAEEV